MQGLPVLASQGASERSRFLQMPLRRQHRRTGHRLPRWMGRLHEVRAAPATRTHDGWQSRDVLLMSTETSLKITGWVLVAAIFLLFRAIRVHGNRITALETRMALVESNATETVLAARQVQTDIGRLPEAVLRWRMSLPTNRVSIITNAAPTP